MSANSGSNGFVQVALDGPGKKIRNLKLDVLQDDGTIATVYQQVVSIVDEDGQLVDFADAEFKAKHLYNQERIIALLQEMVAE